MERQRSLFPTYSSQGKCDRYLNMGAIGEITLFITEEGNRMSHVEKVKEGKQSKGAT